MIKGYIARAMMIAMLESDQIRKIQERERARGYLIPNCNIQELLGLSTIRERFGVPEEPESQISHNQRIEFEIDRLALRKTELYEDHLQWTHMFDWNVYNEKGKIVWSYSGASRKGFIKNLIA